jgi:hypothetical protein
MQIDKKMKKLKLSLVGILSLSLLSLGLLFNGPTLDTFANTDAANEACDALTSLGVECEATKTAEEVASGPVRAIINTFSIIVGAASVIMIIFGGFKFITSGGDAEKTKTARNTIIYAAIGLAVVVLAQFLVLFVFDAATELSSPPADETTFFYSVDKSA